MSEQNPQLRPMAASNSPRLELVGRRGSHFTRLVRMFAHDAGLAHTFTLIPDMSALDPAAYGGHPALKLPVLRIADEPLFGAENICRWLTAHSARPNCVIWSEDVATADFTNAQELIWLGMNAQVQIIMAVRLYGLPADHPYVVKLTRGLQGALSWLDCRIESLVVSMPRRDSSLLEISLFCLISHLLFVESVDVRIYRNISSFHDIEATRPSAIGTEFALTDSRREITT